MKNRGVIFCGLLIAILATLFAATSTTTAYAADDITWNVIAPGSDWYPISGAQDVAISADNHAYLAAQGTIIALDTDSKAISTWSYSGEVPRILTQVTVDNNGILYVVDAANNHVLKISPNGDLLAVWGEEGSPTGPFESIFGIAVNTSGDVFVGSTFESQEEEEPPVSTIKKFSASGELLSSCEDAELIEEPVALAVDPENSLFVVDSDYSGAFPIKRVQRLSANWEVEDSWEICADGPGVTRAVTDFQFASDGTIWTIIDARSGEDGAEGTCSIKRLTGSGAELNTWKAVDYSTDPYGFLALAFDSSDAPHLITSNGSSLQKYAAGGTLIRSWGSTGTTPGKFANPGGIARDTAGNLYVADTDNNRIQKFSSSGEALTQWGSRGAGTLQFDHPLDVAVSGSSIYVADSGNNRISQFSLNGDFVRAWGSLGVTDGKFSSPSALAADAEGAIYVADTNNGRVQKFSASGAFLLSWGAENLESDDEEFKSIFEQPNGITVAPSGEVLVVDSSIDILNAFTQSGEPLFSWELAQPVDSAGAGDTALHVGVGVDARGHIYITNSSANSVFEYSQHGEALARWGEGGVAAGQFNAPSGFECADDGVFIAVDGGNARLQRLSVNQYHVTLYPNNGTPSVTQKVNAAARLSEPEDPIRTSYEFSGWYRDAAFTQPWDFAAGTVTQDLSLYAKWTRIAVYHEVTYNTQGGGSNETTQVLEGDLLPLPTDPVRAGYLFGGWFKESACQNPWVFDVDIVTDETVIYAKWHPLASSFRVLFDSRGGSTIAPQVVTSGTTAARPKDPAKTGYDFIGWFETSDGLDPADAWDFDSQAITKDLVLYAGWTLKTYTILFEVSGGTAVLPQTIEYANHAVCPSSPVRAGYVFEGWYADPTYQSPWVFNTTAVTSSVTIYAKWTQIKPISVAVVSPVKDRIYAGTPFRPTVSLSDGGKQLRLGVDYTVSYKNNTRPGKASVTIAGRGYYTGSRVVTFKIAPKRIGGVKLSSPTRRQAKITWKRDPYATGYEVCFARNKKFTSGKKVVRISKNSKTTYLAKKLGAKKVYYVRVRAYKVVDGKRIYGAWSALRSTRVK